ncbi:7-methylguanosine phosphate-specific 5'-nucleotidase [Frankliniella fusca]|uniref:5'-nucleotidase n=1 Tax=Frankliniella fusca TaxID=407009 RepID=A0AAE1LML7_9NEOP|nr:7-methylguanosine phosphate-specific 5'-nucleotidase [Frankliniella fusca]
MGDTGEGDMKSLLSYMPELGRSSVHIKDPKRVSFLLNKLVSGGVNTLQIIADFDHTVTKQHVNGVRHTSSFCVINQCNGLPPHFSGRDSELLKKYLPIERDPHLTKEEKTPYMIEWYSMTSELLQGFPLDPNEIVEAVKRSNTELRSGFQDLVTALDTANVPLLVFSAGLGDVVDAILKHHGVCNKNIHIISNFLNFKDGLVNGFTDDIVHPFNKNGKAAEHTNYFKEMSNRHNVILMGDNLGDAEMADGVPNTDAVLKIGFLFGDVDRLLPQYLDHFDVVLEDDQTMDIANSLVRLIKETASDSTKSSVSI